MTFAGETLPDLWMARPPRARTSWAGAVVAIGLHVALGAAALTIDPARFHAEVPIEIDVEDRLPPPEVKPPTPEPPPPPPEARPRIAMRRAPAIAPPPPAAPPPPSEEPPKPSDAPPTFGVTMSSVVSGPGPGMAVPIGDTLMTKPGKTGHGGEVKPTSAEGIHAFVPVAEMYISEHPVLISAPSGEDIYPPEAKRLGIEGVVRFKVGIDEKGKVVQVKVVEQAGHGFDEAATKAMWQAKFKPAISTDGRPVPYSLIYAYRFNQLQ